MGEGHRTRTALTLVAPFFRARQMQMFPKRIQYRRATVDSQAVLLVVDDEVDGGSLRRWRVVGLSLGVAGPQGIDRDPCDRHPGS